MSAPGSLSLDVLGVNYTINFDSTVQNVNNGKFTGAGLQPEPTAGQLDSDAWAITGLSDGNTTFGGTGTTGDFARGSSSGGVTTGGLYGFTVASENAALGFQPATDDWTPGTLTLRLKNSTGFQVTSLYVAYVVYVRNDAGRANSFNFSWSTDNSTYTPVAALNLASPESADQTPAWVANTRSTVLSGLSIPNDTFIYLRWTGDDIGGSGSRDEFALDDISLTAIPEPAEWGLLSAVGLLGICGLHAWRDARKRRLQGH